MMINFLIGCYHNLPPRRLRAESTQSHVEIVERVVKFPEVVLFQRDVKEIEEIAVMGEVEVGVKDKSGKNRKNQRNCYNNEKSQKYTMPSIRALKLRKRGMVAYPLSHYGVKWWRPGASNGYSCSSGTYLCLVTLSWMVEYTTVSLILIISSTAYKKRLKRLKKSWADENKEK